VAERFFATWPEPRTRRGDNPELCHCGAVPHRSIFSKVHIVWIVALATSAFKLVWSSITLFNEPILNELGFDQKPANEMLAYLTGLGLISNLVAGKLASRKRIGILLGVGLLALSFALAFFPSIGSLVQLRIYGAVMGFVGGIVTVVHFSVWGQFFGRAEIGRIQGVAQVPTFLYGFALLTLIASILSFLMQLPIHANGTRVREENGSVE
jgi:MFS family permease